MANTSRERAWTKLCELIAEKVDVPALLALLGINIVATDGDWARCLCPFHDESKPSFSVALRRTSVNGGAEVFYPGSFSCFGCGCAHNVVGLVAKVLKKSMREAAQMLVERFDVAVSGMDLSSDQTVGGGAAEPGKGKRRHEPPPTTDQVVAMCTALAASMSAQQFLADNGVPFDLSKKYHVGLSGDRIAYPYWSEDGVTVLGCKYHAWLDVQRAMEPKSMGTTGAPACLYPSRDFIRTALCVITEGERDALALRAIGINSLTMTGGVNSFRAERIEMIRLCPEVVIMIDQDESSRRSIPQYVDEVRKVNPKARVRIAALPLTGGKGSKDVCDLFRQCQKDGRDFREVVLQAIEDAVDARPVLDVTDCQVNRHVDVVIAAVVSADSVRQPAERVYVHDRRLSRVVRDANGYPGIEPIPKGRVRELVAESVDLVEEVRGRLRSVIPSAALVEAFMARGEWIGIPKLDAVLTSPRLRPSGEVASELGYDQRSRLLCDWPSGMHRPVPDTPTQDEARAALDVLCGPIEEFPFESPHDRAVAVALTLSILARPAVDGPVPVFAMRATSRGTGKGLLTRAMVVAALGREVPADPWSEDDDEMRKSFLTYALSGSRPVIMFDNLTGVVGTPLLAMIATANSIGGRRLGTLTDADVPWRSIIAVNGNNLQFASDLGRRVLVCDLDARCESPESREFKTDHLVAEVRAQHPVLVQAGLTVLRAYACAGSPRQKLDAYGSFEAWDRRVRHAMVWAGGADWDPCGTRVRVTEHDDQDREDLVVFARAWHDLIADQPTTVSDLVAVVHATLATADQDRSPSGLARAQAARTLHGAMVAMRPRDRDPNVRSVGRGLVAWAGRIVDGLRVERLDRRDRSGVSVWRVSAVATSQGAAGRNGAHPF